MMEDFLDVASDLLRAGSVKDKQSEFERVFAAIGALQAVHSKAQLDLTNIESIFTALELGNIIQKFPGLAVEEIPLTISALKELIVKTLEVRIPFPTRKSYIGAPPPYDGFAELVKHLRAGAFPTHSVSVITFNYDVAVDIALFRAGLGPDYVIERPPQSRDVVQLMKLHGSLNWASQTETKTIRPLHLVNYFQKYSIMGFEEHGETIVPFGVHLQEYFGTSEKVEVNKEPVIVPPSWNKADYHQALSNVWAAAAKNLSEAQYVFVIGYSLPQTDSFFRHLYALGSVGSAPLRKLIVYNPDTTAGVDNRFKALLGPGAVSRYEYRPVKFPDAIDEIRQLFPSRNPGTQY